MRDGHSIVSLGPPMPDSIKRHERRTPVAVDDAALLAAVVEKLCERYGSLTDASRQMGISRRTLRRLADRRAGATVTRSVYERLELEAEEADLARYVGQEAKQGRDFEQWLLEEGGLVQQFREAVVTVHAEALLRPYRGWLGRQLGRFGHGICGSIARNPYLDMGRWRGPSMEEFQRNVSRELPFRSTLISIRRNERLRRELNDFERHAKLAGNQEWHAMNSRCETQLTHSHALTRQTSRLDGGSWSTMKTF